MEGPGNGPEVPRDTPLYQSRRPGRYRKSPLPWIVAVVALLLALGGGWWWWTSRTDAPPEAPPRAAERAAEPEPEPSEPTLTVPELDESDPVVRELLSTLSEHPEWARWLVPDDLVRRFVTSVVNVGLGESPRSDLDFMEPEEPFAVREAGDGLVVDPASYGRYDRVVNGLVSLPVQESVRVYRLLVPLFEDAHAQLGLTDRTFEESLSLALGNLLAVQLPQGDVGVHPNKAIFEFDDTGLEAATPAEKHLYRLGPENGRRVQEKLGAFAAALGLTPRAAPDADRGGI